MGFEIDRSYAMRWPQIRDDKAFSASEQIAAISRVMARVLMRHMPALLDAT